MKQVNLAILGFGTVGSGIYKIVEGIHDQILEREGLDIRVKKVLVRSMNSANISIATDKSIFTTDFADIENDPDIDTVAECMGGIEPARTYILSALRAGRSVVTSNKKVFANHWGEMDEAARKSGAALNFEATAGGGIPIVRAITHSMQGNRIECVMGIVNGTTNYILTEMATKGESFGAALQKAQELGYAEADPTDDVEAFDAMYKLSILGSLCFHTHIPLDKIYREGITKLTIEDIQCARELGYAIKLLAIGKQDADGRIEVRVHPTMLPIDHPMSSVSGSFNAVFMHGHSVDDVMLYGRGAGCLPTASALVSDIILGAKEAPRYATFDVNAPVDEAKFATDWKTSFFVNIKVEDKPGVLAAISSVLGKKGISLASVMQRGRDEKSKYVNLVFITHQAGEQNMQKAMAEIQAMSFVQEVCNLIRVEGN